MNLVLFFIMLLESFVNSEVVFHYDYFENYYEYYDV